jgi:WD40 repeat protein/tetratricopeptide (TPR) repeat protein
MAEDLTDNSIPLGATVAEPAATPLSPPGYELEDEIGRGGMGVVYRARDVALDRNVAVKLLSDRYPPDSIAAQRFLSEARITGQLQHPGIPAVHQIGTLAEGRPFLAMKLIKGSTLETILKYGPDPSAGRGPAGGGLAIFEAVCQAVGYAHAHRVIHRDLKPANVMVGAFGEVQVMDWGLAKVLGEASSGTADALSAEETQAWTKVSPVPNSGSHTEAGSLVGTPAFIAPEQAGGQIEQVNERSDVFGLGAILAVILTGKPPYVGESFQSVRLQAVRGKLDDCFARLDACGAEPELVALCKQCLAFEPADRPADAGAVAEAVAGLRAAADERARQAELERVQAEADAREADARAAEQRQRRRMLLVASAVIALVLLTGLSVSLWQMRRAMLAETEANTNEHKAKQSQQDTAKALKIAESEKTRAVAAEGLARSEEEAGRKLLYTADMRLAWFVWRDDRSTAEQLRILLEKHTPERRAAGNEDLTGTPRKPDLRGFEWYYYQHLLEHGAAVFSGHGASVVDAALTTEGPLVTLDQNGQVRRWDLGSRHEDETSRRDLPGGPGAQFRALSPDGRLAALAEGNKVRVYDTATGHEKFAVKSANPQDSMSRYFRHLIFSRNGDRLVIVDDKIRWLSAASGAVIASLDQKLYRVECVALSADGLTLAIGGFGDVGYLSSLFRLDASAKTVTPLATDVGVRETLSCSALTADGGRLAVGAMMSGHMAVFDAATGRLIGRQFAHASPIRAIAFSDDGARLATGDAEGTIKIWAELEKLDSTSAALLTLKGHQGAVSTVVFSRDGKRLVSSSADKTARVWDLENAGAAIRPLEGLSDDESLDGSLVTRFSPDGQLIAAANGRSVRLWDAATGRLVREVSAGEKDRVTSVAFSPSDNRLLAVGYGGPAGVSYVALWDIDTAAEQARLTGATDLPDYQAQERTWQVGALAFSPDGKYLVAGFGSRPNMSPFLYRNTLKVWDVATRRVIRRLNGHRHHCVSLDFSRDGSLLASGSHDGTAIIWSTATWEAMHTLWNPEKSSLPNGSSTVEDVAFSPDGKTLALASYGGAVQLWDVATGKLRESLKGHPSRVMAVAFSPDGRTLASGGSDQTVRLWNVATRRELLQLDHGGVELGFEAQSLAFSPDGRQLLTGWRRGAAVWSTMPTVWNDPDRAAEKLRLLLHSGANFRSRIRMFSENLRLHEALAKLDANDPRVRAALAATQANWHASRKAWPEAVAAFDRLVAADPKDPTAWLRTPGLLRLATALLHQDRPSVAATLLQGGAKRRAADGIPPAALRGSIVSDPATGEVLDPLRALVNLRLAEAPGDARLLELRAELAGQWSGSEAQIADYSAAIEALAHQTPESLSDLKRLYRGRGNAYASLKKWAEALDDYAHLVADTATDDDLLTNRARANEALRNWEAAAADWPRAVSGNHDGAQLLGAFARRLAAAGQVPLAKAQFEKSRALYERVLEAQPENNMVAAELAQLLFDQEENESATRWAVLRPTEMKSKRGATLSMLPDESVLASGKNPLGDGYTIVAPTQVTQVSAIRLEALTHESLPNQGPGRSETTRGNFSMVDFTITATTPGTQARRIEVSRVAADHHYLELTPNHWNVEGGQGRSHIKVDLAKQPVECKDGTRLEVQMEFSPEAAWPLQNLGRFRLSVSSDPAVFDAEQTRFAGRKLRDPWARLAVAYAVNGRNGEATRSFTRALELLAEQLAKEPENSALAADLFSAYQSAGRTREAVPYLAKASAADPSDMLLLKVAALQAWFGQEKELAATRQRMLAFAKDTNDAGTAEHAAKACSILPYTDKAELDAALALARKGAELGEGGQWWEWRLLALGMAEYRSGNHAAATEALLAAETAGPNNAIAKGIAAFYRAMSLYRQGKPDEARQLAIAAAVKMKPLPKDEQNPPTGDAYWDDLILWLAYKEAKAMIQFDAAPTNPATPDGK